MTTETTVRERPILFSGPMVRAILEGRKTQTRRVLKNPDDGVSTTIEDGSPLYCDDGGFWHPRPCPYGQPGDRLWVREAHQLSPDGPIYRATAREHGTYEPGGAGPWRPSIHMPRWASRITLEITDVRVERVQEITEDDAIAEGVEVDMLCDLLGLASQRAPTLVQQCWISGANDESISYCRPCAEKEMAAMVEAGADEEDLAISDGDGPEDCHRFCDKCERQLNVALSDCAIKEEVKHFAEYGIQTVEEVRDFRDMIDCGVPRLTKECGGFEHMPELTGPIARVGFRYLWDSLNAPRGYGWDANPWCWVLSFRVLSGAEGEV